MALTLKTNVIANTVRRNLNQNANAQSSTNNRLSTGRRINQAKDDAAGLAISERFTSQIRGLNQAIRNANDGISLAQVGESALSKVSGGLQRILAQAGSLGFDGIADKATITNALLMPFTVLTGKDKNQCLRL